MKTSGWIAIFLLLYGTMGAQSSGIPDHSFQVDQHFVVEQLSAERLSGFAFRAKQQLTDFANYIALLSNPEYDKTMRQHAYKLALALFDKPECQLSGVVCGGKCTAKSFLEGLLNSDKTLVWTLRSVQQGEALTASGKHYLGRLHFQYQGSDAVWHTAEVAVILKKIEKRFGDQSEWIWEVKLGDMKRRP